MLLYPKQSDSSEYKLGEVIEMLTNFERGENPENLIVVLKILCHLLETLQIVALYYF